MRSNQLSYLAESGCKYSGIFNFKTVPVVFCFIRLIMNAKK